MDSLEPGASWTHDFSFTQEQVNDFARITGDNNPLHLDPEYAATTAFKRPIMHGMLSACVFSKVFGTINPGPKSIYLSQTIEFLGALYVDTIYRAEFTVIESDGKRRCIQTQIKDKATEKVLTNGQAWLRVR